MHLRLLLAGIDGEGARTVVVSVDDLGCPTIGDVFGALALPPDATGIDGRRVDPATPAHECLVDGATLTRDRAPSPPPAAVTVAVVGGPDAGRSLPLAMGGGRVGRDPASAVAIDDRTVSRAHLEISLTGNAVSAHDLGSVNGSRLGDEWITTPTAVAFGALVHVGASTIRFQPPRLSATPCGGARGGRIALVRPPRHQPRSLPAIAPPPSVHGPSRLIAIDLVAIAVPVVFALLMAVAFDPRFALMGLIGPVLAVSNHFGQRRRARRDNAERATTDRQARAQFRGAVIDARRAYVRDLHERTPDLVEVAGLVGADLGGLWQRRPSHDDFLSLSVGYGPVDWTPVFTSEPRDIDDITRALLDEQRVIDDAPIVVDARQPIGIRGEPADALALARALVLQAAAVHGPADLRIVVATTDERRARWAWTAWLPHTFDSRADARLVVSGEGALRETVEQLLGAADGDDIAHTLVVVDDASLVANRATPIRQLLAGQHGATTVVVGSATAPLPSLCHTVIDVAADMAVTVTVPARASTQHSVRGAGLHEETATRLAARMARFVDPEASTAAASLPAQVTLSQLLSNDVDERTIAARWDASRAAASFVVPIGVDGDGPLMIDLVHDGPHILVAGTTGSGKSELLRTLIASLAATVDAERVNFLLVDYKGGSAFDRCAALPHTVGVVTDLDGRLTNRALTCLEAELRRRERALRDAGVDDIAEYHRRSGERRLDPLPRLVVVVDEFAALVSELPQFVDALIDIGQRGRSLGVHIILATQRPSGIVKDALRANTNLRISLRVLDQNDSRDVLGVTDAALISRRHPGRAIARLGAAELLTFQTASVTGRTATTRGSSVEVIDGSTVPAIAEQGPSDLERLVDAIANAHRAGGFATAWRPWPDPLPHRVVLDGLQSAGSRSIDEGITLGLADVPHEQRQDTARWYPNDGPLLVQSLRGGGATTALSTIAIAAARSHAPDRLHVYVLDLGAGDLAPLAALPHCGAYIAGHETERTTRLLRMLGDELRTRKERASRDRARRPVILVIIDNVAALALSPEAEQLRDALRQLVGDGAAVDIHVALSTDRAGALGHAIEGLIAQRLLLRTADATDYALIGVRGIDPAHLPPGRGFLVPGGTEIQLALPGDAGLAAAVAAVSESGARRWARPIAVLPVAISLRDVVASGPVAPSSDGWIIGLFDRTLGPATLALAPGDHALIAGPARSGKSSALGLIAHLAQRDGSVVHIVAPPRSPLRRDGELPGALSSDALAALVDGLIGEPPVRRHVIVVDDADLIDDGEHLERLLATGPLNVHVVAGARADRLRAAYRHWTIELRRSRLGILLRPDDIDGELLGVRLPRNAMPPIAGRGYLITEHGCEIVQIALHDAEDHAA